MAEPPMVQAEFAIAEYTPRASKYEASNAGWHAKLADDFISWIKPEPGEAVLDLACGTGLFSVRAADKVGPDGIVVGVDVTPAMLDIARSKLASQPSSTACKIEFIEADIADPLLSEHPSIKSVLQSRGGFDIIVCCSALILLSDPAAAIKQWSALLSPTGRLIVDTPTEARTVQYLGSEILSRRLGVPVPFSRAWIQDKSSLEDVVAGVGLEVDEVITTRSYLPETLYQVDQGGEVFERVVLPKYGREFVLRGIVEQARKAWRELWEEAAGRAGRLRDGHWLYVCVGKKKE